MSCRLSFFVKQVSRYPRLLLNGNSHDIEKALREGKIAGLVEGNARQSSLHYTPFMKDELVLLTHKVLAERSRIGQLNT